MEQKHQSEEIFRTMFKSSAEGIIAAGDDGIIALANSAACQLFGYSHEEMISLKIEELMPSQLRKNHVTHRDHYKKDPKPRKMGVGRDLSAQRKDGSTFPVEISLTRANLNGIEHTVGFIIDISERKKADAALKRSEEQLIVYASELEKRVHRRTRELDKSIYELEKVNNDLAEQVRVRQVAEKEARKALERERELNELKSRFVSMASHEFRTPLSTILSSAALIGKYNEPGTEEKRLRHVDKIKSAIINLNGILNDFLSLSKLEEGHVNINRTQFDACDLVNEVIDELDNLIKEGQTISCHKPKGELNIHSDEKVLKNILINLTSNAIKYSGKNQPIKIELRPDKKKIQIKVIDSGMGISVEDQKHLFDRFFRAKNAVNIQGTGLGLHIVKKYVDMLDGSISYKSELNKGSTFIVTLPN